MIDVMHHHLMFKSLRGIESHELLRFKRQKAMTDKRLKKVIPPPLSRQVLMYDQSENEKQRTTETKEENMKRD